ncbi:MAG: DUF4037 domain-containing protein, partial [Calditrichia bacterium]
MKNLQNLTHFELAKTMAIRYGSLPRVQAVTIGGSQTVGSADSNSDIDLYVYAEAEIPVAQRGEIASSFAGDRCEIDNQFWESGDEWIDDKTGIHVDVMFRDVYWIEDQLDRVLNRYEASVGYSTCILYNVLHSDLLYDRDAWYESLQ